MAIFVDSLCAANIVFRIKSVFLKLSVIIHTAILNNFYLKGVNLYSLVDEVLKSMETFIYFCQNLNLAILILDLNPFQSVFHFDNCLVKSHIFPIQ